MSEEPAAVTRVEPMLVVPSQNKLSSDTGIPNLLRRLQDGFERGGKSRVVVRQSAPPQESISSIRPLVFGQDGELDARDHRKFLDFIAHPEVPTLLESYFTYGGLGDKVIGLRHAFAVARHFPDRTFYIMPEELIDVSILDMPSNIQVADFLRDLTNEYQTLWLGSEKYLPPNAVEVAQEKAFNLPDYTVMQRLRLAGKAVDYDAYYQSIFRFTPEQIGNHPITSDLLIIPDAAEESKASTANQTRSRKSISPEKWAKVFSGLDQKTRVAIVMGVLHPDYCRAVIDGARRVGLQNVQVVSGTLDDVTMAVLSTRKFIGMDSGTTHIAAEVVKAAKQAGRTIEFREIFNEDYVPLRNYGIAGDQFNTLVCQPQDGDLDSIDPAAIADFIKSNDRK